MATIHKRRLVSGELVSELTHGTGRDRVRIVAGKTREEAYDMLKQFERQLALHGEAPRSDSVESVVGQYRQFLQTNRRPKTVVRYMRVLKTFTDRFVGAHYPDVQRLRQLRPVHIEEYKRLRAEGRITEPTTDDEVRREQALMLQVTGRKRPDGTAKERAKFGWLGRHGVKARVSQCTVNYELRVLFTFFHWAIKRNCLFLNPPASVERFRLPKRAIPKFMTSQELKKFFAACDEGDRRLFMSILLTGMRKGEVEHLTWTDISFELGVIFIQEKPEMKWQPKTDERLIPISPMLQELLILQYQNRRSEVLVFANRQGNRDAHSRAAQGDLPEGSHKTVYRPRPQTQLRCAFAYGGREPRRHWRPIRTQRSGDDTDLRQGSARTLAVGDCEADAPWWATNCRADRHRGSCRSHRAHQSTTSDDWLFFTTSGGDRSSFRRTPMARWQPRTPKESLQASLERLDSRIKAKRQEITELETQKKQVEQAIKALG